jgi:predicted nucleotidyltransferase
MMPKNTKLAAKNKLASERQIKKIVERVVSRFLPDKIILFGSYAAGTAGPDSDLDLLVVMSIAGSRRNKAIEIGVALHDIAIAKDVIVVTPEDFEWRKDIFGTIEWPAAHQGEVLYARK